MHRYLRHALLNASLSASLALLAVESKIEQVTVSSTGEQSTWYRVRVGPQASLAKADADAAASKTGDKDVSVGVAYLGYQQYDKAAAALERGLGKGGVTNQANAQLLLGIAQLGAGRKEEARKAFKAVKGNPTLERLANLWTLHAQA